MKEKLWSNVKDYPHTDFCSFPSSPTQFLLFVDPAPFLYPTSVPNTSVLVCNFSLVQFPSPIFCTRVF